ncbi:hypothetical protein HW555_001272, partial [Spodoptera exigua]
MVRTVALLLELALIALSLAAPSHYYGPYDKYYDGYPQYAAEPVPTTLRTTVVADHVTTESKTATLPSTPRIHKIEGGIGNGGSGGSYNSPGGSGGKGDKAEAAPILCTPVKVGAENIESIPFAELLATNFGTDQIQGGIGNGGMGGDYDSPGGF